MTFEDDIRAGHLEVEAFADGHALRARALLERLPIYLWGPGMPLRLAIAQTIGVEVLATADHGKARAAEALRLSVVMFGQDTS